MDNSPPGLPEKTEMWSTLFSQSRRNVAVFRTTEVIIRRGKMSQVWEPALEKAWKCQISKLVLFLFTIALRNRFRVKMLFDSWHNIIIGPWKSPLLLYLFILIHFHIPLPFLHLSPSSWMCLKCVFFFICKMDIMTCVCVHTCACMRTCVRFT